ncbi:MAG: hypothetical protein JXR58_05310, partial [Bacteroidales bacterium]|nr:hypothetical protein [Bacteroidales bacterium]
MKKLFKYNSNLVFTLVFVAFSFFYGFHEYLFSRPHSYHAWRQADCGAIALNYYQDGMNFFEPELHQQNADDGKSGHNVSEFPIINYFVASLYHIFGYHEFIFRIVSLLIFYLGLLFLFKFLKKAFLDDFWAIIVSSIVMLSYITIYYSISFLPNTSALAFVFIGWYFFYLYYESN